MRSVPTYIVEKNKLFREGIKSFLSGSGFSIIKEYDKIDEVSEDSSLACPKLILMGIEYSKTANESVAHIKSLFPDAYTLILISYEHENSDYARNILSLNADGYILKNVSPNALVSYINLALMGEKILPVQLINMLTNTHDDNSTSEYNLSDKEESIIRYLTLGYSNKLIAQQLFITEATVKVHLKTIQRKLNMHNRTQIALWAVNNGFNNNVAEKNTPNHKNETTQPQRVLELVRS